MAGKLGIIAGGGRLPRMLVDACLASGRAFHVFARVGQADPGTVEGVAHDWYRFGQAGAALKRAQELDIKDVVLAGTVQRPSFASLRPDWKTLAFLMRLGRKGIGDDSLLRRIIVGIEAEGLTVVGADTLLDGLKPVEGRLGRHAPDADAEADIARGIEILSAMGAADVGQAVVVQQGMVLGVEAIEGTDALLERCAALKREGTGGVLVKLAKRGQESRADLPTVGPDTVRRAAAAGLRGIAVGAGATIVLERDAMIRLADDAGLFVVAIRTD